MLRVAEYLAAMPESRPLAMPVQSLKRFDRSTRRKQLRETGALGVVLARLFVFLGALGLAIYGAAEMYGVISVGATTALEWALLCLFVINFSWISFAFTTATLGFFGLLLGKGTPSNVAAGSELSTSTAIVVPIYNEDPLRVFAALEAMIEAVAATGQGRHFHWFVLSDSTNPDVWLAEEAAYLEARRLLGPEVALFYRHRPRNTERKAGNISDFVSTWGGAYEHMLVLDADSQMEASTIIGLARAMELDPDAGIIQSVPLVVNRNTLFARLQQFAARIYGPVLAEGLSLWSGRDGNYWGHNAIIRVKAFAECCRLPELKGEPPFGGHIMSHDFVEAALIRRGGWRVYMLARLGGSYEESPPSLIDLAARDRRWCQGNLQHARVIRARGLHWASRVHFATGIMSYVASPIWLAQLLVGILIVLQSHYVRPEYFTDEFALLPAWPQFDAVRALWLFGTTLAILLIPKLYGFVVSLLDSKTRRGCGGAVLLFFSTLVEIILSALVAPIMMMIQTGAIARILLGRDSGWNPQRRDDGGIPFMFIFRRHLSHTLLGVVALVAGLLIAPSLVAWMSPTIAGLILASLLSWAVGQRALGILLRRWGLLLTPEETCKPAILERSAAARMASAAAEKPEEPALVRLLREPHLLDAHVVILPPDPPRPPGQINVDRAVAAAKLADARSVEQLSSWLKPAEQNAFLNDRRLLRYARRLPITIGGTGR
ncbi:MAG: Glucans biosynthesis glucosyltransferase [Pseudomonadota bacterium]